MDDNVISTIAAPQSPSSPVEKDDKQMNSPMSVVTDANPNQCHTVLLCGQPIAALMIDGNERLCLAQISNTLLKNFSYNEIHNRRVALGITCVQCTPVQLEILRRAGAMPVSSRRCGMISKREAERLCKSFLCDNMPPKLPDNFAFECYHACAWGCRGNFAPSRYNSSRAKCIKCIYCNLFFSPNKFIFHSHRTPTSKYQQPDAANFNSWRRHIKLLDDNPSEALLHAWEDVKAMFNGGSRKRSMYLATTNSSSKTSHNTTPPVPKSSRLELDPVINSLSMGRSIGYPIMPIPNRSFPTKESESIVNDKHEHHALFGSSGPVFGRQFTTQAIRPRTFSDLFWPNRVPYPFPTGFWPKGRDANFAMVSGAASMDKKFGTPCCPLTPENSVRFLGSLKMPTGNVIDNEREELREGIKTRAIPILHSYSQDQIDLDSSSKYTSAFRRVGKKLSPERDLGFLENSSEGERLSSPSDTRDDTESSPVSVNTCGRFYAQQDTGSLNVEEGDDIEKEDNGGSGDVEYVEETEAREDNSSIINEACCKDVSDDDNVDVGVLREDGRVTKETLEKHYPASPVSPGANCQLRECSPETGCEEKIQDCAENSPVDQRVATDELKRELLKEVEERERINRENRMYKDSFEGFMKREVQYRQLKDQLCLELDQERKARLNSQQKLKEAQETLQEISYKMLLSRHCVEGSRSVPYPRTVEKAHNE